MRKILTAMAAAVALIGCGALASNAQAQPIPSHWAYGHQWCLYPNGWHGGGWYWCNANWNHGYGWGGGQGWNGWTEVLVAQPVGGWNGWGGHRWCWYDNGWHGEGWYWCGANWRQGYGWGGGFGWNGWGGRRGWRGGVWIGF
jgi:hypothetical protein